MKDFKFYNYDTVKKFIAPRVGEMKFGEQIQFVENFEFLKHHSARYVLFGIPEDIGVRANLGKAGARNAWKSCLKALLNIQSNHYVNPKNLVLLGEVRCEELLEKASNIDEKDLNYQAKLGDLVTALDLVVSHLVEKIVQLGKIPIIIGGGHNNAYGNIRGTSIALKKTINVLNIDAHTDLRTPDVRHSGNGFSFASRENFLGDYRVFGLHKNYTPEYIFEAISHSKKDHFYLFEDLLPFSSEEVLQVFQEQLQLVAESDFGLELDCDSIADFPSSAISPSGFSIAAIRNFLHFAGKEKNIKYLHICEAAPDESSERATGKALSYFITDFIQHEI